MQARRVTPSPAGSGRAEMNRILILVGLILVAAGLFWPYLARLGLGHLPGDIAIRTDHGGFYFPIGTCIVISVALSAIFWLIGRF
jgi:hypothetical protein